jgi:hypothetical protein
VKHAAAFHPTKGPTGSIYQTQDNEFYVRTPWGVRKVDPMSGQSLLAAQSLFSMTYRMRRKLHLAFFVLGGALGAGLAVILR